jgi:hypothetical protein
VERKQLVALGRHRSSPRGIVLRIEIVSRLGQLGQVIGR